MNTFFYFFRLFIPIALLLITGAWLYSNKEIDSTLAQVRARDEASVRVGTGTMLNKLESLNSDLIFLASNRATNAAINHASPENIAALSNEFLTFSASKLFYDQIRWIDETGMERVRVDFRHNAPELIPDKQLQDKSKRYFFIETIKLIPGQVFTSPLDLNIEHDQVEVPFKPMLRIATPVADQLGQKRGIIILNYLGSDLLQTFTELIGHTGAHNMVVNSNGYWLKSDNPADEWGFMFNRPELSMAARSPATWQRIRDSDQGQVELDDGLWTWKTVYPLNYNRKANTSNLNIPDTYFWKVISHDSHEALDSIRLAIWMKVTGIFGLFLGLYGLGSWKLAKLWSSQAALELKYRTVANFAYDWETWIAPTGQYLYCSPSSAHITGYSAQAFLANPQLLTEIVHPDDLERVDAHFQRLEEAKDICQLAFRIVRSDGEIRWIEHACQPVFNAHGTYLGRRASNRDITERKEIEARLRVTKDSLNNAQRIAHLGSWTLNLSNKKLVWSDEIYRLLEIDPNQSSVTHEAFLNVVHPEDRDAVNQAYIDSLTNRTPYEISHRLLMSDGRIKWVHARCTIDFDGTGKPLCFQGTVQDITLIKEKEFLLQQNANELRQLHDVIQMDMDMAKLVIERLVDKNTLDNDPQISYYMKSAVSFSGDLILAKRSPLGHLFVMVADATGHGLSAAISAMPALWVFYGMVEKGLTVAEIAAELNERIKKSIPLGRFVAAHVVSINFPAHTLSIWSGGMPSAWLIDDNGGSVTELPSTHPALGIFNSSEFDSSCQILEWHTASHLLLLSDGVSEAQHESGSMLGEQPVLDIIHSTPGPSLLGQLTELLENHLKAKPAMDDVSIACISLRI